MSEPTLPANVLGARVPRHTYAAGIVCLFVQLVLDAACGLRSSSAVLRLLAELWPALTRTPVANTGQGWLLRLGLFELTRPKEAADDWCWIIDHTIQLGTVKCLLIVGIRLSVFQQLDRPLEHRDLQMMALEPVEKSDGAAVCRQLEATCVSTGIVPRVLLSDEGTDLLSGYRAFSPLHPEVTVCHDIAHLAANFLRRELEGNEQWGKFTSAAGTAKQRLAQTPLAPLLSPKPRTKARYMNLNELVNWGENALRYLDAPQPLAGRMPDLAALEAKLGWLREYRDALLEWKAAMQVVNVACDYVRRRGYHSEAALELTQQLALHRATSLGDRLATRLVECVRQQSAAARSGERLIGSSECLESLIGKGKRMEGQQSQSGFTKMVLALAAAVVTPTQDYIERALTQVKHVNVLHWCRKNLGISLQAQRQQAFRAPGTKMG